MRIFRFVVIFVAITWILLVVEVYVHMLHTVVARCIRNRSCVVTLLLQVVAVSLFVLFHDYRYWSQG